MKNPKKKIVTVTLLTALSGAAIYVLNKAISATSVMKNLLASEEKSCYEWQFGNIFYTKQGSGSPILLIHDLQCGSSGYEWKQIAPVLAKDHTVYCIDLLGCGRSAKPQITYTNFLYVQLITNFIRHVIGCPADVIATGLSASFAVTACNNTPEYFRKLMLINPEDLAKLNQIPGKRSKFLKGLIELPLIGTLLYNIITSRSNTELLFTENYYYNPFHRNPSDVDVYYESAHLGGGNGKYLLASLKGNYVNLNISHALRHVDNSIFIVGGAKEEGIEETIALYTSLNTSIEAELIPKSKHLPQLETPDALLEKISIFF